MNKNSIGSLTTVKNTAIAVEINIDLYLLFLSASTFLYIAKATPIKEAVDKTTYPALNLAGTTVDIILL